MGGDTRSRGRDQIGIVEPDAAFEQRQRNSNFVARQIPQQGFRRVIDTHESVGATFAQLHAAGSQKANQDVGGQLSFVRGNSAFRPRNDFAQPLHESYARPRRMRLRELQRLRRVLMIRCRRHARQ